MTITFEKYHGLGNSFIVVRHQDQLNYSALARQICAMSTGVGADGLIVVKTKPWEMLFFNQDGSRAPMCGNGIRVFAHALSNWYELDQKILRVKTLAGMMKINIETLNPFWAQVEMGQVSWDPQKLGIKNTKKAIRNYQLKIGDQEFKIFAFFLGTIHTMLIVDDLDKINLQQVGKALHEHELFTEKTNVNFIQIIDEHNIKVRTYERGVGLTLACGTGASASAYLIHYLKLGQKHINVHLTLGTLKIDIKQDRVFMSGPSAFITKGEFNVNI